MSDITKDDLRLPGKLLSQAELHTMWSLTRPPTDEEFDRLAREVGYIKVDILNRDGNVVAIHEWARDWVVENPAKALRALLTDQCDCMGAPWCNRHNSQYINDGYCERVLDEEGVTPENMEERACQEEDHYDCHGRGWLPKDGVWHGTSSAMGEAIMFPADWLEAEGE